MTPESMVEAIVSDLIDIYNDVEMREWLRVAGGSMSVLPSDMRSHIWSMDFKRTAREVYLDLPYYVTIPEFLEFWNRSSLAERLAHMVSDRDDETPFECWE